MDHFPMLWNFDKKIVSCRTSIIAIKQGTRHFLMMQKRQNIISRDSLSNTENHSEMKIGSSVHNQSQIKK